MKRKYSGFTLVELMTVVAVISILVGVAIPSYMQSIRKSNRTDAKTELTDLSQRMQRCYTTYGRFDNPPAGGVNPCTVYNTLVAGNYVTKGAGYYKITIGTPATTRTQYTLTATPVAGKTQANDVDCTSFTLDYTGTKKALKGAADNTAVCW